jgi:hypothetical protein
MTFEKEHQFFTHISTLKEYIQQSKEQQTKINDLKAKLRELEASYGQTQKHIEYYLFELENDLKTCHNDNCISVSAEVFSTIINALSWLENNGIVEQGFLNAVMDSIKQNQKG